MEKKTLLLTPYYFPIQVLCWQDAIKMRYEGTVDVVAEYGDIVSSPSVHWQMPAVIRLRRMPRSNRRAVKFSRVNVYQRDGWTCQYCGAKKADKELSFDHVLPRASGGRTVWENIVTACKPCNTRKAHKSCDESGMWPLRPARRPISLPLVGPRIDPLTAPQEWHAFLRSA
ncbi:MAG: HNH endonuclease [Polyangiaceae bacterium]